MGVLEGKKIRWTKGEFADLSSRNLKNPCVSVYCHEMKRMNNTITAENDQNTDTNDLRTVVQKQLGERGLQFRRGDAWDRIEEHIGTHKYLLDLRSDATVDWAHAADSWERTVMKPLLDALERQEAVHAFPDQSIGDLYIEVSDHWYYLKQERPSASPDDAVASFTRRFGTRIAGWFPRVLLRRASERFARAWRSGYTISRNVDRVKNDVASDVTGYGGGL